jgi:hypothetical protein
MICMIFNPKCRTNIVSQQFPNLCLSNQAIQCVSQFHDLDQVIDNQLTGNEDFNRETRNLVMRTNYLLHKLNS